MHLRHRRLALRLLPAEVLTSRVRRTTEYLTTTEHPFTPASVQGPDETELT